MTTAGPIQLNLLEILGQTRRLLPSPHPVQKIEKTKRIETDEMVNQIVY